MAQTSCSRIWTTTSRKCQRCSSKNMRWNWMQVILEVDQRSKQNHKDAILSAPQELFFWGENLDRCWTRGIFTLRLWCIEEIDSSASSWKSTSRKWWSGWILEIIFRIILCFVIIGLTKSGRTAWQEEEDQKKKISIVLILQKKFFTSELFKVIQDAISLIFHYRTMSWFRTVTSSTFLMSDVQSIYIPSSIRDWHREVKVWRTHRQYSFCLWVPWIRNTRIQTQSTWKHRVLHNTCRKHGRNIKNTVCWVDINLVLKKGLKFFQTRSNVIILHETLPAYFIPKVFRMEIGEVIFEKAYASPRPPAKISF